ncbi:hypothetical protein DSLASN_46950 [Desulfoluna limicola]|uniref:Uncharacterized protein n=1 Tax=Desulfoluna limicola TaxID=2810562 RepID=A0ABN6FA61_9BACT|nr:hypothetical protein DSLASN_46950 [Desulfoluna limicola]
MRQHGNSPERVMAETWVSAVGLCILYPYGLFGGKERSKDADEKRGAIDGLQTSGLDGSGNDDSWFFYTGPGW